MPRTATIRVQAEIFLTVTVTDDGAMSVTDASVTAKANDPAYVATHPDEGIIVWEADPGVDEGLARDYVMTNEWPTQITLEA